MGLDIGIYIERLEDGAELQHPSSGREPWVNRDGWCPLEDLWLDAWETESVLAPDDWTITVAIEFTPSRKAGWRVRRGGRHTPSAPVLIFEMMGGLGCEISRTSMYIAS